MDSRPPVGKTRLQAVLKGAYATYLRSLGWLWIALLVAVVTFVAFGFLRTGEENEAEDHFTQQSPT